MLRIEKIKFTETYENGETCFNYDEFFPQDINLIIGPNASGKSQFISLFKFLRNIHSRAISTQELFTCINVEVVFFDKESKQKINYKLSAGPGSRIDEKISNEETGNFYLKHKKKGGTCLFDEKDKEQLDFLVNKRESITKQIEDHKDKFPTIYKIGRFFETILFLDADKFDSNAPETRSQHLIPNDRMNNISSVVLNWKKEYPELYEALLNEYKKFFLYVENFSSQQFINKNNVPDETLSVQEKGIKNYILSPDLSNGMLRTLNLLALPMVRQLHEKLKLDVILKPGMIIIDEIDNGLDYEVIGKIIDYLKGEAAFYQILFSSHSPVVCNFIKPKKWHIFRRQASKVKITRPLDIPATKELIEESKSDNYWAIYKNHIAKSSLYSIK